MDNLSLLKLLGEALAKAKSNNSEQNPDTSSAGLDKIAQLFNSFSNKKTREDGQNSNMKKADSNQEEKSPKPLVPLQSQMLGRMKTHDDFIKRVLEKNNPT